MRWQDLGPQAESTLEQIVGYLNFSEGKPDPQFQRHVNWVFGQIEDFLGHRESTALELAELLRSRLAELRGCSAAFQNTAQAEAVLGIVFERLLPGYLEFHRDLLHHQNARSLWRPLFVCRACEAVLTEGGPWNEHGRVVEGAIGRLNDFLGYRPIPVLEQRKLEPYPHEWVAALPLYVAEAGVAVGRYHELITQALDILRQTDEQLLAQAWFDMKLLDELAVDPRAYDFDQPVNKRPNFHFGQWDPHRLDQQGRYRRFVLQQITLDAMLERVEQSSPVPRDELLVEAGAVLAGTMLMAAAVGGRGPDTHDSSTTLATLLPRTAATRDAFYERLIGRIGGAHGRRLEQEAQRMRQPFGGARQHLNQRLARLRATQLQHVHLAQLFARMGYSEASVRQAQIVPVASARMLCEINARITGGHHALARRQLDQAATKLPEARDLLERAIQCGALVDPWNILGFQGQFALFPAIENTVRDHRVDVLIHVMSRIFSLAARVASDAAADGRDDVVAATDPQLDELAQWWDQYASIEVSGVDGFSGQEAAESARHVAAALSAWHEAGEAAGDIAFWRNHVEQFNSPKAYALVVGALLDRGDYVASMALIMQWLGQRREMPLEEAGFSLYALSVRWLAEVHDLAAEESTEAAPATIAGTATGAVPIERRWPLTCKFLDFLEANAEEFWEVPHLGWEDGDELDDELLDELLAEEEEEEEDAEQSIYGAAYEDVTFRDSAEDGIEGEIAGDDAVTEFELQHEAERIGQRLALLATVAQLWKIAAASSRHVPSSERDHVIRGWLAQAEKNRRRLLELLEEIRSDPLPDPSGTHASLVEYDRQRQLKESLLGRVILTCVEMGDAARMCRTALGQSAAESDVPAWEQQAIEALRFLLTGQPDELRHMFPRLLAALEEQQILYVPLGKGGTPRQIVEAQDIQRVVLLLLRGLPRLGLLAETCQLIVAAQSMEKNRPRGEGTVTEFDRLFETGYRALVHSLIDLVELEQAGLESSEPFSPELVECLQQLTESLLSRWHTHSRSVRLSVLEKVADKAHWDATTDFIRRYGSELFTPQFMNLGNLRTLLHQGAAAWLQRLEEEAQGSSEPALRLLEDLDQRLPRQAATAQLTLVAEAIIENYAEFKDFNSTTTQSDHGELLYMLLDMLRLKASYERFAWNIKPVVMAHEVLVRRGRHVAAELWRRAVIERTSEVADWHLARLDELSSMYGMRLPTVADHLEERFVRVLSVDRMRARVKPAIEQVRGGQPTEAFERLEQEIADFTEHPTGAGLDVPDWLIALEQEAEGVLTVADLGLQAMGSAWPSIPRVQLTWEEVHRQLDSWEGG